MTFKVVIPDTIRAKIREQALFIANDQPQAALHWYDTIFEAIFSLEEMPTRCPMAPENLLLPFEIRQLISGNYRMLFRIDGNTVVLVDFKETHQNKPA